MSAVWADRRTLARRTEIRLRIGSVVISSEDVLAVARLASDWVFALCVASACWFLLAVVLS